MTATRTTVVQNVLEAPGTGRPIAGRTVTIRLNPKLVFTDGGHKQKLRTAYATTDATGLWSCELEVNGDITDPAGSYYTVSEDSSVPLVAFVVPYSATPLWLRDCLENDPTNPNPIVSPGPTLLVVENTDGTFDLSGSAVTDNGDGTYTISAA